MCAALDADKLSSAWFAAQYACYMELWSPSLSSVMSCRFCGTSFRIKKRIYRILHLSALARYEWFLFYDQFVWGPYHWCNCRSPVITNRGVSLQMKYDILCGRFAAHGLDWLANATVNLYFASWWRLDTGYSYRFHFTSLTCSVWCLYG